jgi:conjugative relaxase-like TrwC/TraI family protein
VLTVTGLTNGEYLISSVAMNIDEYYAGAGESPGVWTGRWAERLGLSGVVDADQLRSLVDGLHPVTGESLVSARARSVRAFDVTLSAPKSVSLLWAFGSEPVVEVVAAAHREAVAEALGFLEQRAAVARQQSGGVRRRVPTEGFVVAGFVHRTSREGDPQLHTHCLVPNVVERAGDRKVVAFDAGPMFEWARAAGSIYQNHLQRSLTLRLGVEWGPDRHNTRELEGFTRDQLRAFSKRSAQIEAELEAKGAVYESPVLRMRADDQASLATRRSKDRGLTPSRLAGRWEAEADGVDLSRGADLEARVCWRQRRLSVPSWEELAAALVDPESGLCARNARFTHADVVEQLCAHSGGRQSTGEIAGLAERFLASDLAVRLTRDLDAGRRRPAEWSTAAHRALEDRTVALVEALAGRSGRAVDPKVVEATLAGTGGLGEDQADAVRVLTGPGGSLRAALAPAGYGKTTMLRSAVQAAASESRPVIAVATTAKAVAELAGAGLDARTIARLRVDLADGPLAAGTVVVLDEISQTPTGEVEAVLAAVDACPDGSVWVLGDPRQSQPVGAGGIADHLDRLAASGQIPAARLTVNRRQVDPADRRALDLLRQGKPVESQQVRTAQGWEHEHATPAATRMAMADAVCADIGARGAHQVAAVVVSHGDAEDLADRIRARLAAAGVIAGPVITGPGWCSDRDYQAGDRVLLHARCGGAASRLVNGTTATVTDVGGDGLTITLDNGATAVLKAEFVQGTRKDGSPNLSHAWARTVDGAQGGTWETCHLLGSLSLDAYRGYTGQSRSRQPTHTWNTTRVEVVDHGGILADQRDGAEQVADALARQPDPSLAARTDPWTVDRDLRQLIDEHERVLAGRPADSQKALAAAAGEAERAQARLSNMDAIAGHTARRLDQLGALAGLSRRRRDQRRILEHKLAGDTENATAARHIYTDAAERVAQLRRGQDALERFEAVQGWRRDELIRLCDQLDHHWADVVTSCVRADDPLAFGIDKLRNARITAVSDLYQLDASIPSDRITEWEQNRGQLADILRARHDAERQLAERQTALQQAGRRHWGRRDHEAIAAAQALVDVARQRTEQANAAEQNLRERLDAITHYQDQRRQAITDSAPARGALETSLMQLDGALDHTRPDRVRALADQPESDLVERLGPAPSSLAGRAVWCHHAVAIEAVLDRNDSATLASTHSQHTARARQDIALADRCFDTSIDSSDPTEWAKLAQQAATLRDELHRNIRLQAAVDRRVAQTQQAQRHPGVDTFAAPRGPELSL